jgi:hypothetical protein
MKRQDAKIFARDILAEVIGSATYSLENYNVYSEEDAQLIAEYIMKLGERACKAIGADYTCY